MATKRGEELFHKYLSGTSTLEEEKELAALISILSNDELKELLGNHWDGDNAMAQLPETSGDRILAEILSSPKKRFPFVYAAAATVLLGLGIGAYIYLQNNQSSAQQTAAIAHEIPPGSNQAILKLANGKKVYLTASNNGFVNTQANVVIKQYNNGTISYTGKAAMPNKVVYDTLTTPNGGTYHLILQDGTSVQLNAATSLRFPETFNGNRHVQLLYGEAYFEVRHHADAPFSVVTANETITDIGTHFNVNTYNSQIAADKITLVEGSVDVKKGTGHVLLKPGDQATVKRLSDDIKVDRVDPDDAIAWKNGLFMFDHERLDEVMAQLARWYNIKIRYEDEAVKNQVLLGSISRFKNMTEVLNLLQATGQVRFKLYGKVLIVDAQ